MSRRDIRRIVIRVLRDPRLSKRAKTAAGLGLTQRPRRKPAPPHS